MNTLFSNTVTEASSVVVTSHAAELHTIQSFVALMIAAIIVGMVAHRIRLPYTVSLILVGVAMSALGLVPDINLTRELLMVVFLPALLFEAAIHFPASELKKFAPTIITLAAPGVLLTAFATAVVLNIEFAAIGFKGSVSFLHFLLFGTIIAATDPISVISLLRNLGVERRLSLLIEGESLFNDGTAIVLYTVVLNVIESGSFSVSYALTQFALVAMGGIFIGAVLGLFASLMITFMDDHLISIAFTTVTAYGSYLVAEELHVSGVLATVTAGLFIGNIGKKKGMKPNSRIAVASFWEFIAFFMASIVFLMMGLEVNLMFLIEHLDIIFLAFLAVLASRAFSVYVPLPFLKRFMSQGISIKDSTVLWWGGLRGALSMVLVLSLPEDLVVRDILVAMVFGVVVLSVVVQGSTMGFLLQLLKMRPKRTEATAFLGRHITRLRAINAQLDAIAKHSPQDIEGIKDISVRLHAEKGSILKSLEDRRHNEDFQQAVAKRTQKFENHLKEVAKDSYRESLEESLLNEEELGELTSMLEADDELKA